MKLTVAVIQYDVPHNPHDSATKLAQLVKSAVNKGAKLIVAPETAIGEGGLARDTGVDFFGQLSDIARKYQAYLATSFYRKEREGFFNHGYIVNPKGEAILDHKKIYIAKPEKDNLGVIPGENVSITKSPIGKLGMLVCKDGFNRYSHFLYERFNKLGAEIICIPAWSIGWKELNTQEYVKSLYVYGAFASRSFILMADCINETFNSYGRSLIVSPVRGVLKEGSVDKEEILIETLDLSEIKKARSFDSWWQPKEKLF